MGSKIIRYGYYPGTEWLRSSLLLDEQLTIFVALGGVMDLISVGELLVDFTPSEKAWNYTANPGGAPANVAIAAARNGIATGFLGMVGADDFGRMLLKTLSDDGVAALCQEPTELASTTLAFVTLYEGGERSFTFVRKPGADMLLSETEVEACSDEIRSCRLLNAGSFSLSATPAREATVKALREAHAAGRLVSFDINYRDMVWHSQEKCLAAVKEILPCVDLLKISDEELYFVGGEDNIPAFMQQYGITALLLTLGSQGARYFFNGKTETVASRPVKAIDATGAGDAFWGGFLSKLLLQGANRSEDITEEMLRTAVAYGNAAGGLCVQKSGGIPALPTGAEIESFMG